jgi:hypothetical protein
MEFTRTETFEPKPPDPMILDRRHPDPHPRRVQVAPYGDLGRQNLRLTAKKKLRI